MFFYTKEVYMQISITRINSVAMLTAVALLSACNSDSDSVTANVKNPIEQESVALDKVYAPSLFYSNINPVPNELFAQNAKATFDTLSASWSGFKNTIGTASGAIDLTPYYSEVDGNISIATTLLDTVITDANYPVDITDAHLALESVRDTLGEMRGTLGMEYFMDDVTTAHHAMEAVSGAYAVYVVDNNITQLCASLDTALPIFDAAWNDVNSSYTESHISSLYDLSTEKSTNLTANVNTMSSTIGALNALMPTCVADEGTVAAQAAMVKPVFVKAFLAFGDFITPFMADMITMEKAFTPVLYCTNNPPDVNTTCNGLTGAGNLLDTFVLATETFQAHYPIIPSKLNLPATIYWKSDFDAVNTAITNALAIQSSASTTADLLPAHDELEAIRTAMYQLRSTFENYDFITDHVTTYHHAMEPIGIAVKPLTDPSEVNQTIKDTISAALPGSFEAMNILEQKVPDMNLTAFGVDAAWLETQNSSIAAQLANLQALQNGLDDDNATLILNSAKSVTPLFIPFFKGFGTF